MFFISGLVPLILLLGAVFVLCSLVLSFTRLLNCLIVIENFNVLLLFCCLLCGSNDFRVFFIALMVLFAVEVVVGLLVLTRL